MEFRMASGVSGDRCLLQRWCCIGSHYGMPRGCTLLCDDAHLFTRRTASHSSSSHSPLSARWIGPVYLDLDASAHKAMGASSRGRRSRRTPVVLG